MAKHTPIVTPIIISGTGFFWQGSHHTMSGTLTLVPQTWVAKTEEGTSPVTQKVLHLKSRAAILVHIKKQLGWKNIMQKVHTKDKDVTFIVDVVDDISFATRLTTRVYLPDRKNTTISKYNYRTADGVVNEFSPTQKAFSFIRASIDGITWISANNLVWGSNAEHNDKKIVDGMFIVSFPTMPINGALIRLNIIPLTYVVEWGTEVYEKHFLRINALEIDDIPGWYKLQSEIIYPSTQAKVFETIEIMVTPRES